ncbi:hypothetical protein J6590_054311 [Homalodisca vitripennis]|nr:hypothetical protein J6590_054311 [Homalodisca vitripennis]
MSSGKSEFSLYTSCLPRCQFYVYRKLVNPLRHSGNNRRGGVSRDMASSPQVSSEYFNAGYEQARRLLIPGFRAILQGPGPSGRPALASPYVYSKGSCRRTGRGRYITPPPQSRVRPWLQ